MAGLFIGVFISVCLPRYLSSSYSHQNYGVISYSRTFAGTQDRLCWKMTVSLWKTCSQRRSWLGGEGRTEGSRREKDIFFFFSRFTRDQILCGKEACPLQGVVWHVLRLMGTDVPSALGGWPDPGTSALKAVPRSQARQGPGAPPGGGPGGGHRWGDLGMARWSYLLPSDSCILWHLGSGYIFFTHSVFFLIKNACISIYNSW